MLDHIVYGTTAGGKEVQGYALRNKNGLEVRCISYGCRLTHILVPGKNGPCDVLLGFDDLAGYEADVMEHGAFVGRYAGLIAGAAFELGGQRYQLPANAGPNHLHGTFSRTVFDAERLGNNSVSFTTTSPDGEDGFPGALWVALTYTLTDQNELVMDMRAVSKADTYLNFTNHSYFNLGGPGAAAMEDELMLNAERFMEAKEGLLPTGRLMPVADGAFDFTRPKPIGRDIEKDDPQLKLAGGYDHSFAVTRQQPAQLALAATASHPASGRNLRVYTTQPVVHLYAGNGLSGALGKGGLPMAPHSGYCLETQHFADSPHQPELPSTLLEAGEKYHHTTIFQFGF